MSAQQEPMEEPLFAEVRARQRQLHDRELLERLTTLLIAVAAVERRINREATARATVALVEEATQALEDAVALLQAHMAGAPTETEVLG